jgi:predicted dehydrogenase/NADPH:quinone reductase-like Zn-dependent oxidoreductase
MRQLVQNLKNGRTVLAEGPAPRCGRLQVLVQARTSLISAGTERMLVEFARAGWLEKARRQPDRVRQVMQKLRTDGLVATAEAVSARLEEGLLLGYSHVGKVLETGPGVSGFNPGDRVVSNSPHAEVVAAPANLCARIPDSVTDEQAAFTVIGAIALQGIRLARPSLGEAFVVYGLGLIGLLAVQVFRANGCRVFGVDLDPTRVARCRDLGIEAVEASADVVAAATAWTRGKGVDGVLITASAPTDEIVHYSALMCRKRGRIVLVGVVGLNLRREDFYEKELTFQVSSSYGPGRYDPSYEMEGRDYPYGYVRWTAQRNFEAVLELIRSGALRVDDLVTHRFQFEQAAAAYETLLSDPTALGMVLHYSADVGVERTVGLGPVVHSSEAVSQPKIALIGAGSFARMTLLPALKKASVPIEWVADIRGLPAATAARKFGARFATSDHREVLADPAVDAVFIAVGHDSHADLVVEALEAGKHVMVEKPLALTPAEVLRVMEAAARHPGRQLTVGFNRRFSPHLRAIAAALHGRTEPLTMNYTVNAGAIPPDHWVQDPVRGGGRIIGEACHFIDVFVFLAGSLVESVAAFKVGEGPAVRDDKMSIIVRLADGSVGTVNYFANGAKDYPKETLEVFSDGRVARMENFRRTRGYAFRGFRNVSTFRQDKGHVAEVGAFLDRLRTGGPPLIPLQQLVNVTLASFAAVAAARDERVVRLVDEYDGIG